MVVEIFKMKNIAPMLLLTMLGWGIGFEAAGQSVDTLIEEAIQSNPKLQALKMEYESATYRQGEHRDLPDPVFSTGFFPLPAETGLSPQRLQIGVSQTRSDERRVGKAERVRV